ncbi:hypothetical protein B0H12DRAFT_694510 [Mycena haematopus]|nr:hypothetical protein B0H12DRAFT_694510 [Mycena haematopus]
MASDGRYMYYQYPYATPPSYEPPRPIRNLSTTPLSRNSMLAVTIDPSLPTHHRRSSSSSSMRLARLISLQQLRHLPSSGTKARGVSSRILRPWTHSNIIPCRPRHRLLVLHRMSNVRGTTHRMRRPRPHHHSDILRLLLCVRGPMRGVTHPRRFPRQIRLTPGKATATALAILHHSRPIPSRSHTTRIPIQVRSRDLAVGETRRPRRPLHLRQCPSPRPSPSRTRLIPPRQRIRLTLTSWSIRTI